MADKVNKIAAIFGNSIQLKSALDDLNQAGFDQNEISVLVKNNSDASLDLDDNEVRTYSTGSYPAATLERPLVGGTRTVYETPLSGEAVPGRSFTTPAHTITGVDAGTAFNRDYPYTDREVFVERDVMDRELVEEHEQFGDKVNVNRDTSIEDVNDVRVKDPNALIKDSIKGGALGMLAGAVALLIPGIGPVFAAGPIAAAVGALATGAAVGTTAGALVGLFKDEGVPADRIDTYRKAFEAGKAVVIIKPKKDMDDMAGINLARTVLNRHNPELVELLS